MHTHNNLWLAMGPVKSGGRGAPSYVSTIIVWWTRKRGHMGQKLKFEILIKSELFTTNNLFR